MRRRFGRLLAFLAVLGMTVPSFPATGTLSPWPKPQFFDTNGDPCSSCRLFTYTAGTSTKLSTYSDVNLSSANTNPIVLDSAGRTAAIFLSLGTSYKFVLAAAGSDDPPASPLWTQDNIANVPPNAVNLDVTGTLGEIIPAAGKVMYLSDGSGGTTAGRWYRADATALAKSVTANAISFSLQDGAAGASLSFRLSGRVTGLSGLTAGTLYYVDAAVPGDITATPPTNARPVGVADTSTSLIVSPWVPTADATATWGGRVTSSTQSFGGVKTFEGGAPLFLASGVANATVRTSGRYAAGTAFANVGNVGAGEDNLHSYSLPAATLTNDGQVLRYTAWGTYAADADSKHVRCYFGATAVANGAAATTNGGGWRVVFEVIRTAAATQRASGWYVHTDAAGAEVHALTNTAPAETLSGAITVKCTGESVTDNDIIQSASISEVVG
jgi:hypothetical protein